MVVYFVEADPYLEQGGRGVLALPAVLLSV